MGVLTAFGCFLSNVLDIATEWWEENGLKTVRTVIETVKTVLETIETIRIVTVTVDTVGAVTQKLSELLQKL